MKAGGSLCGRTRNRWTVKDRRHGIGAGQFFTWRRLMANGALTAAGEDVLRASEYRALQAQITELQRLLGKRPLRPDSELVADVRMLIADLPSMTISACTPCYAAKPSKAGAQRLIRGASTA